MRRTASSTCLLSDGRGTPGARPLVRNPSQSMGFQQPARAPLDMQRDLRRQASSGMRASSVGRPESAQDRRARDTASGRRAPPAQARGGVASATRRPVSAAPYSDALELEVSLTEGLHMACQEGLRDLGATDLAVGSAVAAGARVKGEELSSERPSCGSGSERAGVETASMTPAKLRIYEELFEAIIERDKVFGPLLRKVKTAYSVYVSLLRDESRAAKAELELEQVRLENAELRQLLQQQPQERVWPAALEGSPSPIQWDPGEDGSGDAPSAAEPEPSPAGMGPGFSFASLASFDSSRISDGGRSFASEDRDKGRPGRGRTPPRANEGRAVSAGHKRPTAASRDQRAAPEPRRAAAKAPPRRDAGVASRDPTRPDQARAFTFGWQDARPGEERSDDRSGAVRDESAGTKRPFMRPKSVPALDLSQVRVDDA